MKFNRISKEEKYDEWIELDVCDDCGCVNADTYFKIWTLHNEKKILLCESCMAKIFKRT